VRGVLAVAVVGSYPLAVHWLVSSGHRSAAVSVALAAGIVSLIVALRGARRQAAVIALTFSAIALFSLLAGTPAALFLPPVAINLVLMTVFARSLARGHVPLIEQAVERAQAEPGELPESQRRLARTLTWTWVVFFACAAVTAILLAMFAPLSVWSLFTNVVYFILAGILLAAQHLYRIWRGGRRHAGSLRLLGSRLLRQD
jgi:uncharacterized membrane protein